MKKILFACLKGGAGKTTFAFLTAYFLNKAGWKVHVLDLDRQGNLTDLLEVHNLTTYPPEESDFIIIDTPPGIPAKLLKKLADKAHKIVVPIIPHPLGIKSLHSTLKIIDQENYSKLILILNFFRKNRKTHQQVLKYFQQNKYTNKFPFLICADRSFIADVELKKITPDQLQGFETLLKYILK